MSLLMWALVFAVVGVQSLTMQIINYGTTYNDNKVYENTQIQLKVTRSIPGSSILTLSFQSSNPKLAQLAVGVNTSPIKIYGGSPAYVYFIVSSDESVRGNSNVTLSVWSDDTTEPTFGLPVEVHEHDGRSIALQIAYPTISEGSKVGATIKRNYVGDILSVVVTVEDDHPTHIVFPPMPLIFDINVDTLSFEIEAPENDCFDADPVSLDITASATGIGSSIRYLQYIGNDVGRVSVTAPGQTYLSYGQTTPVIIHKNFYDALTVNFYINSSAIFLTDSRSPTTSSPSNTTVVLPYQTNCVETSLTLMAVVVTQPAKGFNVDIWAEAVFKTKTGNVNWRDKVTITVVASNEDNSPFSEKNLPSTVGSILAVLVLLLCVIGGVLYWRNRRKQPAASFGRFREDMEPDNTTQSKFTISDNADAQGYLTGGGSLGNTDQLLPAKTDSDSTDIELSSKVVSALASSSGNKTTDQ